MRNLIFFLYSLVLITACFGEDNNSNGPGSGELVMPVGSTQSIQGSELSVTIHSVSDSRCPLDVVCVWEGTATVTLSVSMPGEAEATFDLDTHSDFDQKKIYHGYTIKLVDVTPYPLDSAAAQSQYNKLVLLLITPGN